MWQKAKIIKAELPGWVGREIWTKVQRPVVAEINHSFYVHESIEVNLIPDLDGFDAVGLYPEQLELLGEFANDVPMLTISDFLKGRTNANTP